MGVVLIYLINDQKKTYWGYWEKTCDIWASEIILEYLWDHPDALPN